MYFIISFHCSNKYGCFNNRDEYFTQFGKHRDDTIEWQDDNGNDKKNVYHCKLLTIKKKKMHMENPHKIIQTMTKNKIKTIQKKTKMIL